MGFYARSFAVLLLTSILSYVFTLIITKLAYRYQWFDKDPHQIKDSQLRIPSFGGIAIFLSFWIGVFVLFPNLLYSAEHLSLLLASIVIVITGLIDDVYELSPLKKTFGILLAANIVYFFTDVEFSSALLPVASPAVFNLVSYIATIVWIYLVTNSINLLDGLDGLASSVTATSLLSLAIITYFFSLSIRMTFLFMILLLLAAILGFLPHNWAPAKIYLGDTGALFIGFMYATLTVTNLKNASFYSLIVPVTLYAVPIFDFVYAFLRRMVNGQPVTEADQEHIHHRLLKLGLSEKKIVGLMISITLLFSGVAILANLLPSYRWLWAIVTLLMIFAMFLGMYMLSNKNSDNK
ncbi:MraY family glycosyltransferase [Fundicoccus culcitae]|uniref:Undecaprenyl/decaprenyl-phosphate alpha-N-acetylglucosaminyl 1-phosphate transferase n=1 Tax=Fundicoccus culcitae TaxID=2969821 RepID=A0ABY5P2R4_9LACT|nr:MraY family glycosyltransferase [Fundicoccus culcitae]UUX32944.1 undecaprenyl/decaprenyl-phosphate alpha-N-acetylglucosaminyl 1-phosphate transferase [Fundicoccus culcitae]